METRYKNRESFIFMRRNYNGVWLDGIRTDIHNRIVQKFGSKLYTRLKKYLRHFPEKETDNINRVIENIKMLLADKLRR